MRGSLDVDATDNDIVDRVRSGDVEAFAVLVDRYYAACHRYATRVLQDADDAEDAVQECFVRAYRALPRYRDQGRFKGWLFRILLNRCRSATARARPARLGNLTLVEPRAAAAAEWVLVREEIDMALAELPALLREAFLLKHVEELSYEEMAALTGDGVSALKMRVARACAALRGALEEALDR